MQDDQGDRSKVIGLAQEELAVTKLTRATGSVRLSTHVEEHLEQVREVLRRTDVEIEHVPMDVAVDVLPEIRTEGDTVVYPVVEEVLVKQLILREEVRITRRVRAEPFNQDVVLRRVRAEVEHLAPEASPEPPLEQP